MKGSVIAHGKCILLGEHSVVRGQPALVFPLASKQLRLSWEASPGNEIEVHGGDYSEAFHKALRLALDTLGKKLPEKKWAFTITSDIPVKAGLGSSAALSVTTVKFLQEIGLQSGDAFSLALNLEDIFHGKSSGIDVAAVLEGRAIVFQRGKAPVPIALGWAPKLYISDTGLRSSTKACVEQVIALHRPDLDQEMGALVDRAKAALRNEDLYELGLCMDAGANVFEAWNLIPAEARAGMNKLRENGAIAVKPTGSGNGGYLLSLWEKDPPSDLGLIPLSADS